MNMDLYRALCPVWIYEIKTISRSFKTDGYLPKIELGYSFGDFTDFFFLSRLNNDDVIGDNE